MKKDITERRKGVIALLLLSLVFASMGIFARFLNTEFTIFQQVYLRIFAAFILGILIFYKDLDFKKLTKIPLREWGVIVLRSISLYVLGVTLISVAFIKADYSNASFISSLPMTAVLGFIFLKEKVTFQKVLYIFLGFLGVIIIAVSDYSHLLSWGQGEIAALISCFFFALSYIATRWHSKLLNIKEITILIFFVSTLLLFITSLLFGEGLPHASSFSGFMIAVITIAGLFNVANLFLTNYGLQRIPAVLVSNLLTFEVVFAVLISIIIYKEVPLPREFVGGLLIVSSSYMMNKIV
ncbi:MAG TPA: DMT family transporter [Candidatus Saccharimonadales bacterium]|nr:DMT family transporter [Candidatus Saccharimonadales bacterium]